MWWWRGCRFESRWATVEVLDGSPAIMLDGMGGSNLGIWCAHGEGRCYFPDAATRDTVLDGGLAPIRCLLPPAPPHPHLILEPRLTRLETSPLRQRRCIRSQLLRSHMHTIRPFVMIMITISGHR